MARMRPYLDHGILEIDNNAAERAMRIVGVAIAQIGHCQQGWQVGVVDQQVMPRPINLIGIGRTEDRVVNLGVCFDR